ncbi:DUF3306 domain-containing protein [Hydrogenophaga sp. PBL-H3]|uniref:DUF3306 domain-containing protein n=1 Tax=Hydrogenophaga sp. PBL-H3 TaxID=434010 RepID=UPI001320432C|nr:DUF3306 domain-containing protein [Hydrogenophaga sp. PBL-H3]QHE77468.1 DUF3306 domain-containing protein [Hydrogenophaga sp. PBL-H3]QHE81892.1 DUF3306 domain-containing protein [Hydrogenophaga sp. PBL-H3]
MSTNDDDNFFSRWSRRKVQVRTGEPLPAEPSVKPAPAVVPVAVVAPAPVAAPAEPEPPPALTLEDVARLTPESDYSAFVAKSVSPDVRNAAVKKLFTDPHYNVMDGLDIYIDDYSQPSPLSKADMAKMVGAQFLKLVDDPNEPKPAASVYAEPQTEPPTEVAHAEPEAIEALPDDHNDTPVPETPDPHDDHADLQLQPDHGPEPEGSGRGPG